MGILDFLRGTQAVPSTDPALASLGVTTGGSPGFLSKLATFGAQLQDIDDGKNRAASLQSADGGTSKTTASKGPSAQLYKFGQSLGLTGNDLLIYASNPEAWAKSQADLHYGVHNSAEGSDLSYGAPGDAGYSVHHVDKTGISAGGIPYDVGQGGAATYGQQRPLDNVEQNKAAETALKAQELPSQIALRQAQTNRAQFLNKPQGDELVNLGGDGAGASSGAPVQGYTGPGATLGDRNNNPFNVKTPPQGMWQGQVGTDSQGHAIFDSPANGMRAGDINLQAYAKHGITTPEAFVGRYVGPDAAPAVVANYTKAIRSAVGDNFDLTNPATRQAIMPAIFHSEGTHTPLPAQRGASGGSGPRVVMGASSDADGPVLSDDAAQQIAETYAKTGQMAGLGNGKIGNANRIKVYNIVGQIQKAGGINGYEAASGRAESKADSADLVKKTAMLSYMRASRDKALATIDQAIAQAKRTGSAAPNASFLAGPLQQLRMAGSHSPDLTNFRGLIGDGANEYAKVIAGGTGNAAPTVESQKEAKQRLNENMTLNELPGARSAAATAMDEAITAMEKQVNGIKTRLGTAPGKARAATNTQLIQRSQQARQPAPAQVIDFRTGRPVQ